MYRSSISLLAVVVLLVACATNKPAPAWRAESFSEETPFEYRSPAAPNETCSIGQRALLSQGYLIDDSKVDSVRARKYFQPDRSTQVQLTFSLFCLAEDQGETKGAAVYANVRQVREELKAGSASTGLSVTGIGSLSLPFGGNNESLVKVGEETVTDAEFYGRFFALMQSFIR